MEAKEIREMSIEDIQAEINDTREELMRMRFQQATGELTDTSRLRTTRREVARLMTILNEKQRQAGAEVEGDK